MKDGFQIVVCGTLVPDPLQTLEPVTNPQGPGLKNEMMLPSVLDPWAAHALFEAANLAKQVTGTNVYLVSIGPKAKLQQLMMTVAQKASFELVAVDGSASGFNDAHQVAALLAEAIESIPGVARERLLVFGGCASASRDAGITMQLVCEQLGLRDFFAGVDEFKLLPDGSFQVLERIEGGQYQVSCCKGAPAVLAWATGNLPEPPNNPQIGMANMRGIMPALMKAKAVEVNTGGITFESSEVPAQKRATRLVKDATTEEIAREIVEWLQQ